MDLEAQRYFARFAYGEKQIQSPPSTHLGMVVVIPCFNEENLLDGLESLTACAMPSCDTEVIVVINASETSDACAHRRNQKTREAMRSWCLQNHSSKLKFHALYFPNLPEKQAGVGLARKIGMDEALRRFVAVGNLNGVIICFDADCTCDPNYLCEIESHFQNQHSTPGCSIYFEHPLQGTDTPKVHEAIIAYELHLRYYIQGLKFAELPYAYHTIGSSMVVRANAYMKQGGMNRRQAGEDFYFLHKIIALGGFTELNTTRVIPSPRPSHRVPFGTGRAVQAFLESQAFHTYPIAAFEDLRGLTRWARTRFSKGKLDADGFGFSKALGDYLDANRFEKALEEIKLNTSTESALEKRFFRWFDAFKAMKFIHFARDNGYGSPTIEEAAHELLGKLPFPLSTNVESTTNLGAQKLLEIYRDLDRGVMSGRRTASW